MSLKTGEQAGVIAVGAATLLAWGAAIFKAANLRGDLSRKWSSRVELAVLALDEKTVVELRELRAEIDTVLPAADAPFDPGQVVSVDPAPLSERVERTAKYYTARVRMEKNLARARRLARIFVVVFAVLALATTLLTLRYAEIVNADWLKWAGFILGGLALIVLILAGTVYVVCADHLAGDEILADTAAQAGGGAGG